MCRLKAVRVIQAGTADEEIAIEQPMYIEVEYWHFSTDPALFPSVNLHLSNEDGVAFEANTPVSGPAWSDRCCSGQPRSRHLRR